MIEMNHTGLQMCSGIPCPQISTPILPRTREVPPGSVRGEAQGTTVSAAARRDGYDPARGRSVAGAGVRSFVAPFFTTSVDGVHRSAPPGPLV